MINFKLLISNNVGYIYSLLLLHHTYIILEYFWNIDVVNASTDPIVMKVKKYGTRYYTMWNFGLQIVYLITVLIEHFIPKTQNDKKELFNRIKGYMFVTLVGPCSVFTLIFFWIVYISNRELLCPAVFDDVFPPYLKHGTHTVTFLIFIVEMTLADHVLPKLKDAFLGFTIFHGLYNVVLFGTYFHTGEWIYKLFEVTNWIMKIGIIGFENVFSLIMMLVIHRYENTQVMKLKY